jgi:membrane protease YdiL (CAAX protease family)
MEAFSISCGYVFCHSADVSDGAVLSSPTQSSGSKRTHALNAVSASALVLVTYFALAVWVLIGCCIAAVATLVSAGADVNAMTHAVMRDATLWVATAPIGGAVTLAFETNRFFPEAIRDRSHCGAAWVPARLGPALQCFGYGMLVGLAVAWVGFKVGGAHGVHSAAAPQTRLQWWLALISVNFAYPTLEELLFRGVAFGGFAKSFRVGWAGALTSVIFIAVHGPKLRSYGPFASGLVVLAIGALMCRIRFKSVLPAIAFHIAYNTALSVAFLLRS